MGLTKVQDALDAWSKDYAIRIPITRDFFFSVANSPFSLWAPGNGSKAIPVDGAYGTSNTPRILTNTTTGSLSFGNAPSGKTWSLASVGMGGAPVSPSTSSQTMGTIILIDRIADVKFTTAANTYNFSTFSATTRLASIEGAQVFIELTGNASAATNITFTYTNENGVGSQSSGTNTAVSTNKTMNSYNQGLWAVLNGTDQGVRSIEQVVFSANTNSNVTAMALVRPLAFIPCVISSNPFGASYLELDCINQIILCDKIYNASCLSFLGCVFDSRGTVNNSNSISGEVRLVAN